jgi:hypothetical protein
MEKSDYTINIEKLFERNKHPFIVKALQMRTKEKFFILSKSIFKNPVVNIMLNNERSLKLEKNRDECCPTSIQTFSVGASQYNKSGRGESA